MRAIAARAYEDREEAHIEADDLMVATLRALGYGAAMDAYEGFDKWHA